MELRQAFLKNNPRFKQRKKLKPQGLVLHSVGVGQPSASVFINSWNRSDFRGSCVHGIIDADTGVVYQTLPWDFKGWHAGSPANDTHIGVEMAEPSQIKYTKGAQFKVSDLAAARAAARRTYESAVELFAMLCKQYGLDPMKRGHVISHSEAHKLGIGTNHADPEHLWKGLEMPYTMDGFRQDVLKAMGREIQNGTEFEPYRVRVVVTNLNIRTGPSTSTKSRGHIEPGVYTIVEEQNGWGLLKAYSARRDGWIYLQYANRV